MKAYEIMLVLFVNVIEFKCLLLAIGNTKGQMGLLIKRKSYNYKQKGEKER